MLVYLLIPVALAIVFFTMSFLQRDTVVAVANVVKEKTTGKKPAKKAALPKKLTSKDDEDKPVQSKNFVEELDIKDYASIQGRVTTKAAKKVAEEKKEKKDEKKSDKKSEKKDEKKDEKKSDKKSDKKDEKQEIVSPASPDTDQKKSKKKKQTEWTVQEQKPQRKITEKKEETTEVAAATEEGKGKKGDKKGDRKGDKKGDRRDKKGEKKEELDEKGEKKEKSIYKVFKKHGADADKEDNEAKNETKEGDAKTEESATKEGEKSEEKGEKKEKKERKERTERPKKKGPPMLSGNEAYANPEDFWSVDHKGSYVEPVTVTTTAVLPTSETTTEKKEKKEKGPRKEKQTAERPSGRSSKDEEKRIPATIKVNTSASLARTDPWKGSSSPVQNTTEDASTFPALGEKASKTKKANKKKGKQEESASSQEEDTPQKKGDSHKREADTLFEYEVEAPSDKKIKLGAEAQTQPEHQDETFVLPSSTNAV